MTKHKNTDTATNAATNTTPAHEEAALPAPAAHEAPAVIHYTDIPQSKLAMLDSGLILRFPMKFLTNAPMTAEAAFCASALYFQRFMAYINQKNAARTKAGEDSLTESEVMAEYANYVVKWRGGDDGEVDYRAEAAWNVAKQLVARHNASLVTGDKAHMLPQSGPAREIMLPGTRQGKGNAAVYDAAKTEWTNRLLKAKRPDFKALVDAEETALRQVAEQEEMNKLIEKRNKARAEAGDKATMPVAPQTVGPVVDDEAF